MKADRRSFPRVHLEIPVRVRGEYGEARLYSHDIARNGLQVRCDRACARRLNPGGREPEPGAEPRFRVALDLPVGGRTRPLTSVCLLVHESTVAGAPAQREVALGLRFADPDAALRALMEAFVSEHLEPAPA